MPNLRRLAWQSLIVVLLTLTAGSLAAAQTRPIDKQLAEAAAKGDVARVESLLDAGAAVDSVDRQRRTPLMLAMDKGRLAAARVLVRRGASLEAKDHRGQSVLDRAGKQTFKLQPLRLGEAERAGTIDALRSFVAAYPIGSYADEVRTKIAKLERTESDWQKTRRLDTIDDYQAFLRDHAGSGHEREAVQRLQRLRQELDRWSAALASPSIEAYASFARDFQDSRHIDDARTRLAALHADRDVVRARADDSLAAWESFARAHPLSAHRQEAGRRIEALASDPSVARVRSDIASLKPVPDRVLLKVIPVFVFGDAPDQILVKQEDYAYRALRGERSEAASSGFEQPLLRYTRPLEIAVMQIAERTLLASDEDFSKTISGLFVALAKFLGFETSKVRFVTMHTLMNRSLLPPGTKFTTRQTFMWGAVSDDRLAAYLPALGSADRTWAVDVLQKANWRPTSTRESVHFLGALNRWDEVVNLGSQAVDILHEVAMVGQRDISEASKAALRRIDPSGDRADWAEAARTNTVAAYRGYLSGHPTGFRTSDASQILARELSDDRPVSAAFRRGTEQALKEFVAAYPGHARSGEVERILVDLHRPRDIVDLLDERKIEVQVTGAGIQNVSVRVRKLVEYPLSVRVPVGSYFVAGGRSQNMVATEQRDVRLINDEWQSLSLDAACANRPLPVPTGSETFSVRRPTHAEQLARVASAFVGGSLPFSVRQAAVWIVTDNATYSELGVLVRGRARIIREIDTARAMKILEESGVDLTSKAIWRDRQAILSGVKDPQIRKWLEARIAVADIPRPPDR